MQVYNNMQHKLILKAHTDFLFSDIRVVL